MQQETLITIPLKPVKIIGRKQYFLWEDVKKVHVYGEKENPLFLAKDVAEWIEHSNTAEMIRNIDEDEKLMSTILISDLTNR